MLINTLYNIYALTSDNDDVNDDVNVMYNVRYEINLN